MFAKSIHFSIFHLKVEFYSKVSSVWLNNDFYSLASSLSELKRGGQFGYGSCPKGGQLALTLGFSKTEGGEQ